MASSCRSDHRYPDSQRGTDRVLTYNAFHMEAGPTISIFAIIQEGDRLLDRPET